ncbi:MAG: tetratricopeptide repeat protein [Chthoniobacterales bacterium]
MQSPAELTAAAKKQPLEKIFVNPRGRDLFAKDGLSFAAATPQDTAALASPQLWRKLDRTQRFGAVLLAGTAAELTPLLAHLAQSPDFRLEHVDNWGALFVRGLPAFYRPPDALNAARTIDNKADRGAYLAQMALMLDAVGQPSAAREYLDAALGIAPKEAEVQVCAAALELSRKHYADAIKYAQEAQKLDPKNLPALEVEARAFAAAGAADEAWRVASEIKSRAPEDMSLLFLHARLANSAHAYTDEQDSLERLVSLAEQQHLSATDYHVYLGQCFARQGLARPALQQLELALKDPAMSKQQREDLTTAVEMVRSKAGDLAQ